MPERARPPRILVSRAEDVVGERWEDYADALADAGADPDAVDLSAHPDPATLVFDALVLTAGVDVDPARYGRPRSPRVTDTNAARDAFEEGLIAEALRRDVPLLAICRGAQVLNTALGGVLDQHLEEREPHRARRGPDGVSIASGWHPVAVAPGSLLHRVAGRASLRVNSRHHQAIRGDGLAPALRACGVAPDGVVEAVEHPGRRWVLGVQWHPERAEMLDEPDCDPAARGLFAAFVAAAGDAG